METTSTMNSPLALLGIPRWLVDAAVASDDYTTVKALAESVYRTLILRIHPDQGGDSELFSQITDAINELRDDDALAVACHFYADPTAASSRLLASQAKQLKDSQALAINALAGALANTHQLSVFGMEVPVVALLRDWNAPSQSYVLRMTSAERLRFSQIDHHQWVPAFQDRMYFYGDTWHELCIETTRHDTTDPDNDNWEQLPSEVRQYEEIRARDDLVVIGGVPFGSLPHGYEAVIVHEDQPTLTASSGRRVELSWSLASNTWWLPKLRTPVEIHHYVAVLQPDSGQLALLSPLICLAPLQ